MAASDLNVNYGYEDVSLFRPVVFLPEVNLVPLQPEGFMPHRRSVCVGRGQTALSFVSEKKKHQY